MNTDRFDANAMLWIERSSQLEYRDCLIKQHVTGNNLQCPRSALAASIESSFALSGIPADWTPIIPLQFTLLN